MLDFYIPSPRGWMAATAVRHDDWFFSLPDKLIRAFASQAGDHRDCTDFLASVLDELNDGRGFVLLDRIPIEAISEQEARFVYWGIGELLGSPVEQNIQGDFLYEVIDTGQRVSEGARFSVTNAESTFHTDAAFADESPEFVGLLCLQEARLGGDSQLVSAYSVHNLLLAEARDSLAVLYDNYLFDRRGHYRAGEEVLKAAPIFRWDDIELDTRYLHYYITEGHRVADPLTRDQFDAVEKLKEIVQRPELCVELSLQPGQILFTNNHWIFHNRAAFEDFENPAHRRHLVRLWLHRKEPRV